MGTGDLCRAPPAAVCDVESGKVQGRDCMEVAEMSCGNRARGVSIQGKPGIPCGKT